MVPFQSCLVVILWAGREMKHRDMTTTKVRITVQYRGIDTFVYLHHRLIIGLFDVFTLHTYSPTITIGLMAGYTAKKNEYATQQDPYDQC